jgi:hypothetical protein
MRRTSNSVLVFPLVSKIGLALTSTYGGQPIRTRCN